MPIRKYTTPVKPNNNNKKNNNNQKSKPKRNRRKRKFRPLRIYTRMPAARVNKNRSFMTQVRNGNSVRLTGYDLIYNTSEGIIEGPFCVVTCNPAYWNGTRIAAIANSYAQYRPLHMCFDYYPQVSTMNNGNVITGTIWNNNASGNNLQQTLATSNGGKIFPVYATAKIPIRLRTNLNQNLFNFQGYLDSDTNPFVFIATTQQANNIIPGYFMVSYTFEFKNPLGEGFDYDTEVKTAGTVSTNDVWETTSAVLLSSTGVAAIGTKLIVKIIDDAIQFFLGGSRVGMVADCIIKLFKSRPKQMTKQQEDLEDLVQSNQIHDVSITLDYQENGSSVLHPFSTGKLSLENFQTWKSLISGADYRKVAGLFVQLIEVGAGRYNLGFFNVNNCEETVPEGLYVLKTRETPTDYSVFNILYSNTNNVNLYTETAHIYLQFQDYGVIECEIPVMNNFSEGKPFMLADIALQDAAQVLGINRMDIIGTGNTTLIPLSNNNTRLRY